MILFSRLLLHPLFFAVFITLISLSLLSCERYEYPLAKVKAPANSPEYSLTPNINTSPALVATPGM